MTQVLNPIIPQTNIQVSNVNIAVQTILLSLQEIIKDQKGKINEIFIKMNDVLFGLGIPIDQFKKVYTNKKFKQIFFYSIVDYKMNCIFQQNKKRRIPHSILDKIRDVKEEIFSTNYIKAGVKSSSLFFHKTVSSEEYVDEALSTFLPETFFRKK